MLQTLNKVHVVCKTTGGQLLYCVGYWENNQSRGRGLKENILLRASDDDVDWDGWSFLYDSICPLPTLFLLYDLARVHQTKSGAMGLVLGRCSLQLSGRS